MIRKILFLCLLVFSLGFSHAQNAGTWTIMSAYHSASRVVSVGSSVYALYEGNLLVYDKDTEEVTFVSKDNGLNGRHIGFMEYCEAQRSFILVYTDLNVDILTLDGKVTNVPQIKNADNGTTTISKVTVCGSEAVLATNYGVIRIGMAEKDIKGDYHIGQSVRAAALYKGWVYAATSTGVLASDMSGNLSDPAQWKVVWNNNVSRFIPFAEGLYAIVFNSSSNGLYRLEAQDGEVAQPVKHMTDRVFSSATVTGSTLLLHDGIKIWHLTSSSPEEAAVYDVPDQCVDFYPTTDGTWWGACGWNGVHAYRIVDNELKDGGIAIGGYGPKRDLCYYMDYTGNRLHIAGGRLDPFDRNHYAGTIMTLTDTEWDFVEEDGISQETGVAFRDITKVVEDPKDPHHLYASAGGTGLYEFRNGKYVAHYSVDNSPLKSAASSNPRYVRVDGLNFDDKGNLWMVNCGVDTIVRILKSDGQWDKLYIPEMEKAPTLEKTLFDTKGRFWVCSRRTTTSVQHTAGLLCVDYGGTIGNTRDDVRTYRTSAVNQDGQTCSFSGGVYDIMQDTDGSIWMGTAGGLYVISNPDEYNQQSFYITQIKVPRNDGTNYADYLLEGVPVTAIAADGAGRKWIGTENNGLYLVSPDGTEILEHFESATSPLLSDNIYDIAIHSETGKVMIGTDAGLCAYQSDATIPNTVLDKNEVKVFPNPVRPEYRGYVTVTGLTADADIKITTTEGHVVAAGTSTGGSFRWDCRANNGARVSTGVYYIMVSTSDGSEGIVAKLVVI